MKFIKSKKRLLIVSVLILVIAVFSAFGLQYFQTSQSVDALPCHEVEHHYFSDATYGTEVGQRFVTCHGVYTFGQVTQYVVSYDGDDCGNCLVGETDTCKTK